MKHPVVSPQMLVEMFYLVNQLRVCELSENHSRVDRLVGDVIGNFFKDPVGWYENPTYRESIDTVALYNQIKKKQLLDFFQMVNSVNDTVEWMYKLQPKNGLECAFNEYIRGCVDYLHLPSVQCISSAVGGELHVAKDKVVLAFCLGFQADKPYNFTMRIYGRRELVEH